MALKGIKETKEMLMFLIGMAEAVDKSDADGKIGLDDAGHLFAALPLALAAFGGISEIPKELADMDAAERAELVKMIDDELQLGHAKTEMAVKKGLTVAMELYGLIQLVKGK